VNPVVCFDNTFIKKGVRDMKLKLLSIKVLIGITTFIGTAAAESSFVDPHIPDGERITYTTRIGNKSVKVVESVAIIKSGDTDCYEITSFSEKLDRTIRLQKNSMATLAVHTVRKFKEVTIESQLTVINKNQHFTEGEVKLPDFAIMNYLFRGFPFGKIKTLKISYYGEERSKKYTFSAQCKKSEKLTVNQKTIECYRIEFGMDGFWGRLLPKTKVWYSVESPHYLVRYEGPSGPPGSPKRIIELVSYTVKEQS
jgi:hypothetical protein